MELKEKAKEVKPNLFTKVVVEEPTYFHGKKGLARYKIHKQVFDIYDSVADNAKMISLLFSLVSRIWSVMPNTQKNKLSQDEVDMINYVVNKFKEIRTRADVEFEKEGMNLIDKLMERQKKIGEIVDY